MLLDEVVNGAQLFWSPNNGCSLMGSYCWCVNGIGNKGKLFMYANGCSGEKRYIVGIVNRKSSEWRTVVVVCCCGTNGTGR